MSYCHLCGGYGGVAYTFGGQYSGSGDKSNLASWTRSSKLQGTTSYYSQREAYTMYRHVSTRGTCVAPSGSSGGSTSSGGGTTTGTSTKRPTNKPTKRNNKKNNKNISINNATNVPDDGTAVGGDGTDGGKKGRAGNADKKRKKNDEN